MKNTEQKLKKLFDFQKFEKNKKLSKIIGEVESEGVKLSDDDLSIVNAAGEIVKDNSGNGVVEIVNDKIQQ